MKSPVCHYLTMAAHFLVALVAFDYGLGALGRGFVLNSNLVLGNMQLFQYVVLAASLWCFYLFAMNLQGKKGCKF